MCFKCRVFISDFDLFTFAEFYSNNFRRFLQDFRIEFLEEELRSHDIKSVMQFQMLREEHLLNNMKLSLGNTLLILYVLQEFRQLQ